MPPSRGRAVAVMLKAVPSPAPRSGPGAFRRRAVAFKFELGVCRPLVSRRPPRRARSVSAVCVRRPRPSFIARRAFLWLCVCMAVHGAAAPAHQYAPRFLRAARPVARPEAGERARAARGPVAPRAQRAFSSLLGSARPCALRPRLLSATSETYNHTRRRVANARSRRETQGRTRKNQAGP